jgi:hypothetical protein
MEMKRYLAKVNYNTPDGKHVTTMYKLIEAENQLDAQLKLIFAKDSNGELNLYDQYFAYGMYEKEIIGVYEIDENGEAFEDWPESKVGDE